MKFTIAVIFLWVGFNFASAVLKDEDFSRTIQEVLGTWRKNCIGTSGTTEEAIAEMRAGKFSDDPKLKQYVKCIYDQSATFKEDGELNVEYVSQVEPNRWKNRLATTMSTCYQKTNGNTDRTDRIYKMTKCIQEADPENFGFP